MSIALESSSSGIARSEFVRRISTRVSIFEAPEHGRKVGRAMPVEDSCSSSSIGRNSDFSGPSPVSDSEDSGEVQSSYKGPLDTMDALEESLPIRKGISKFYCGKSKSFTTLADACSSSIKDIGKPDYAFNRKRKNLLACSNFLDKNRNYPLKNNGGGISKKATNSSRSTLALAVAMSSSESNSSEDHDPRLPPLHPQAKSPISTSPLQRYLSSRSFSLTDLQAASGRSSICLRDQQKKFH